MGNLTKSFIRKQNPVGAGPSRMNFGTADQSKPSKESYLRYYNEVSWLRSAISVIAQSIAQSTWRLYKKTKDGDREEVTTDHEIKNLLNHPNPFQSGHDLFEMHQIFDELIGESYWVKQNNRGSRELWLVPPQYMTVIPSQKDYIAGYHFERGEFIHDFKREEIIPFIQANPLDMLTGVGRAQSAGMNIETLSMLSQFNRNMFYWGDFVGATISYPLGASIPPAELDRLYEQFAAGHRSYGRVGKTAILTEGAVLAKNVVGAQDMDWSALSKNERENILGVFGVSYSNLGGTESVNRANADAQLLNFARNVTAPRLVRIREKLNMFLVPDYGPEYEIDFDNPVPEDTAQQALEVDNHVKAGVTSLEEARQRMDLGDIDPKHHFLIPINTQVVSGSDLLKNIDIQPPPIQPPAKALLPKAFSELWKENFWKSRVKQAEAYEPKVIKALREMYQKQREEALINVKGAVDRHHVLINKAEARKAYKEAVTPILKSVILNAVENGIDLINPQTPHKQDIPPVVSQAALDWLLERIGWAAEQTTEETANLLAEMLAEGFANGESISQIAMRVQEVFDDMSNVRALRIARTEVLQASNQGNLVGYKEAGLEKVEWLTARDERTCEICDPMDGEIFNIDDFPTPPASSHPNCRCLGIPVLD